MSPESLLVESRARNRHTKWFAWIYFPRLANISIFKRFIVYGRLFTHCAEVCVPEGQPQISIRKQSFAHIFFPTRLSSPHSIQPTRPHHHLFTFIFSFHIVRSLWADTQWIWKNAWRPEYPLSINWWICFLINVLRKVMTDDSLRARVYVGVPSNSQGWSNRTKYP